MRKWLSILLLVGLAVSLRPAAARAATAPPAPPRILLDGLPLVPEVPPQIIHDRTMVPFRKVAEALGVRVDWDGVTRTVTAVGFGKTVRLVIDDPVARVNDLPTKLDVPPTIINDRTLVPLRFISEAFGGVVDWNGTTRTVTVISPVRPMRTLAFYAIRSYGQRDLVAQFSDVAYGWSTLLPDGTLSLTGPGDYKWPEPDGDVTGERLLADAASAHTQRLLMVYGSDRHDDFTKLVQDPARVAKAADSIAAAVSAKGFDGALIDIEGLGLTETGDALARIQQGFTGLVQAVGARLRPAGKQVIVALPPLNGSYHGYDYAALGQAADFIDIMAYDYLDHTRDAGPNPEPWEQVEEAIALALREVARERLLLGIATPYETPETVAQKAGLAKRYSLAGIAVWRLGVGTLDHDQMTAIQTAVTPLRQK